LVLFDSASTASTLGKKVSQLESKLEVYEDQLATLREARFTFDRIAGVSEAIRRAKAEAQQAAATDLPVLITGESGTGKEIFAQAIHHASGRRLFPLIRVNCAAIPRELFEAELFGYEKGSFTGAGSAGKPGKFELADLGTIFLDEIGDLPRELQPKLLRVLDLREFERVGANRVIRSDFRLITATNRDLEEMVREGRFRRDLYFRLNVVPIHLTALRDRREDVAPLARQFLDQITDLGGFPPARLGPAALTCLKNYPWPGNGRELMHVLERTLATHPGGDITPAEFPYHVRQRGAGAEAVRSGRGLQAALREAERQILLAALEEAAGNRSQAARALGIHRTLLYRKMSKLGMARGAP
jgi:transcriptional regulator with PAS, ATPase and Fis domain